jgi:hypothetical protein
MTRVAYLAVTLLPRVETASLMAPTPISHALPRLPLEIPHLDQNGQAPASFRSLRAPEVIH